MSKLQSSLPKSRHLLGHRQDPLREAKDVKEVKEVKEIEVEEGEVLPNSCCGAVRYGWSFRGSVRS